MYILIQSFNWKHSEHVIFMFVSHLDIKVSIIWYHVILQNAEHSKLLMNLFIVSF